MVLRSDSFVLVAAVGPPSRRLASGNAGTGDRPKLKPCRQRSQAPVLRQIGGPKARFQLCFSRPALNNSQAQPTNKLTPPIGVIAPSHFKFVTARR